jgi:hypothetical protein
VALAVPLGGVGRRAYAVEAERLRALRGGTGHPHTLVRQARRVGHTRPDIGDAARLPGLM